MMDNAQYSWKDFFSSSKYKLQKEHYQWIHPINITDVKYKDIRHFQRLVEQCFDSHINHNPQKINIDDIDLLPNESVLFFDQEQVTNLFITSYYKYPDASKIDKIDISNNLDTIESRELFEELLSQISGRNEIAVIIGDVGEGKSAFLSKFSLDLRISTEYSKKYFPIIINVQSHNDILEQEDTDSAINMFWSKVCEDIIQFIEQEQNLFVPTSKSYTDESVEKDSVDVSAKISSIIASLKSIISTEVSEKQTHVLSKSLDVFQRLNQAATDLNSIGIRMILIFDNLDTLCYEHERFMLFNSGYSKFITKISIIKKIIWGITNKLKNSGASFIFTVRPYVYTHVFQGKIQDVVNRSATSVYKITGLESRTPMLQRLSMLNDLVKKLKRSDKLSGGKKNALADHLNDFQTIIEKCISARDKPFNKFYNMSNQGFRSMVKFYQDLKYHPRLFGRYFSHDIVYLYIISMRKSYSQIQPFGCQLKHVSHFPNLFLVRCNNYRNQHNEEASKPHGVIYWLKFLILLVCSEHENVSIAQLLDLFSSYEEQATRLCIGSLSTVNEYNCLNLTFSEEVSTLKQLELTTFVKTTRRGRFLVDNLYCLGLECLQVYFDDWLFPMPNVKKLTPLPDYIKELFEPNCSEFNYEYLLNGDEAQYQQARIKVIYRKTKQCLMLVSILKHAREYEMNKYPETWILLMDKLKDHKFFHKDFFDSIKEQIITDSYNSMGKNETFKSEMNNFNKELNKYCDIFGDFFTNINSITIAST